MYYGIFKDSIGSWPAILCDTFPGKLRSGLTEEHSTPTDLAGRLPHKSLIRSNLASPDRRQDRRWWEGKGCEAGGTGDQV